MSVRSNRCPSALCYERRFYRIRCHVCLSCDSLTSHREQGAAIQQRPIMKISA
jgi:hypothetical protein